MAIHSHGEKTSCGCCFFVEGNCHLFGDVTFGMLALVSGVNQESIKDVQNTHYKHEVIHEFT